MSLATPFNEDTDLVCGECLAEIQLGEPVYDRPLGMSGDAMVEEEICRRCAHT